MVSLISQQQELVQQILASTNRIDTTVDETVIIVPDIKAETRNIRENLMKIFELEQEILLGIVIK